MFKRSIIRSFPKFTRARLLVVATLLAVSLAPLYLSGCGSSDKKDRQHEKGKGKGKDKRR